MSLREQDLEQNDNKNVKCRKNYNATQIKNQRITRRMKKIIKKNTPFAQSQNDDKCPICLSKIGKMPATLPCTHVFCMSCLSNWWVTNSTCPYCRERFDFIYDYKGRRLEKEELPQDLIIQREQTLKCQFCWADIGDEPMRICFQCRCVYAHKRCLLGQEIKARVWRCCECWQHEQQQLKKNEQEKQKKIQSYYKKLNLQQLSHRHSQRLMLNPQKN